MPKSCRSILYRESKKRISTIMYNILKWWKTLFYSLETLLLQFKCFIVTFNENFKSYNLKKYSVLIL